MSKDAKPAGFTLIELILVMALLGTLMALSAPSLSRSLRDRNLRQEATRFLALTEFARSEAVSRGIPMIVWIDAATNRFGAEAKAGFEDPAENPRAFALNADVQFAPLERNLGQRESVVVEFAPDGTLLPASVESLSLTDRFDGTAFIQRTRDGWGYELSKEVQ